ncbi:transcriptional regulator family: Fungal Specific TF [Penicillium psychrosexuale]|uniref:transcriptional regulator family: Fungal Specific TF n=1 Tax=Penicillium psychrosexuale TaxID=1002107 RepID=UPI002544DA25|nr:transcriptional regulator family: Fungal Specific TF [Penicillium psychrosexuale]KAJ5799567.1 transcriptional regulator family: Fungal Specific TF [Penicillium psychrosexuale]
MSAEQRQAIGTSSKSKRRWTEPEDDGKATGEPKRQRVSRACDSCRSKKDKCDGKQPVCSTCASLCRPCTYKANPKKRGLPTGYIRSLELLWGLVFQRIQGSEDVMRALMRSINLPSHLATMGKETEGSDALLASFKNSTVLRDIERILIALEQPEEERERNLQGYGDGETPLDIDGILSSAEAQEWQIPEGMEARETPLPGISPTRTAVGIAPTKVTGPRPTTDCGIQTSAPDDQPSSSFISSPNPHYPRSLSMRTPLQLPYNAWPLFDVYFSYTQCWFPILEKHDILRTAFHYTEGDVYASCLTPGSGEHAALWAVLALASLQDASISASGEAEEHPTDHMTPSRMYKTARQLIPPESGPHEIGHVQALLILGLVKFGQQEWTGSWMLVGQAVRIAHILGLDQPSFSPSSRTPDQEKQLGRAKHVFLGCFVLETLIAESISQCPSLRKADLARVGAINEDGLEEWHPWEDQTGLRPTQSSRASMQRGPLHALSTFNRLVGLVSILNDLCCCKHDPTISRSQLEQLELQLQRWVTELPKSYRVDLQSRPVRLASPHIFGLEMTYESVVIALSSQIAIREYDQNIPEPPHKIRATESSKKLLQLLQAYVETYSFSATAPTFGLMLRFGLPRSISRDLPSVLDMGLRTNIYNLSSQLSVLWTMPDQQTASQGISQRSHHLGTSPAVSQHIGASTGGDLEIPLSLSMATPSHHLRATHASQNNAHAAAAPENPFLPTPWLRATQHIEDVSLLRTPSSLTSVGGASELPPQQSHLDDSLNIGLSHPTSAPSQSHSTGMLAELSPSYHQTAQYQPTAYHDSSVNMGTFVDMDGYARPRRQRIAPDLDALFDELASLDGAEKADNQPEFMQNLGFVSNAGIPELYSFSSQIDPFLLAETQQLPNNGNTSSMRQEAQLLNMSGTPKR